MEKKLATLNIITDVDETNAWAYDQDTFLNTIAKCNTENCFPENLLSETNSQFLNDSNAILISEEKLSPVLFSNCAINNVISPTNTSHTNEYLHKLKVGNLCQVYEADGIENVCKTKLFAGQMEQLPNSLIAYDLQTSQPANIEHLEVKDKDENKRVERYVIPTWDFTNTNDTLEHCPSNESSIMGDMLDNETNKLFRNSEVSDLDNEYPAEKILKAEIKLLVKTYDSGKEAIEIRSVRQFVEPTEIFEKSYQPIHNLPKQTTSIKPMHSKSSFKNLQVKSNISGKDFY